MAELDGKQVVDFWGKRDADNEDCQQRYGDKFSFGRCFGNII